MSSLADTPDLVGFFSYSREDDEDSGGKLSKLRERIQAELRGQLGRTRADFRLWQDKTAIAHGKLWEDEIRTAIAESSFFIPIVTPTAIRSHHCKFEFEAFLAREKELGRSDLVFPIVYIPVPGLGGDRWREDPLLRMIGSRQYEQWQALRHLDASSSEVALRVEKFCANICRALQQPWSSPEERQQTQARQRGEEARRRREAEQERQLPERAESPPPAAASRPAWFTPSPPILFGSMLFVAAVVGLWIFFLVWSPSQPVSTTTIAPAPAQQPASSGAASVRPAAPPFPNQAAPPFPNQAAPPSPNKAAPLAPLKQGSY
jgi:hypothetical protein